MSQSSAKLERPPVPLRCYIHDSIETLRFQLIGTLEGTNVAELSGCWNTAKTILGSRRLVVDVSALQSNDEAGKEWLLSLAEEGAEYLPADYFLDDRAAIAGQSQRKAPFTMRLLSFFRGRAVAAESSTRLQ